MIPRFNETKNLSFTYKLHAQEYPDSFCLK